jgi:hypothetical protein
MSSRIEVEQEQNPVVIAECGVERRRVRAHVR